VGKILIYFSEYEIVTDPTSCMDTKGHGPVCVCDSYGGGFSKFGFCKPNLMKKKKRRKTKRRRGKRECKICDV
jgi:hypothetical protein